MFAKQYIRTLLAAIALFLGTLAAEAQSRSVTGTVFNDDGKTPLVGCTIIVQGTTIGTTTEANGSYSIKVSGNDAVLVFQSLGYETQTIPVGSRTTINVTLKESATKIADVVVTALGLTREEKSLGYAVSKVSSDAINASVASNWIANMIVGATFLTMLNTLGNANTFWVYAALNVLFILLTLWLVPETKHVSLEHIERNLMKGRKLREIGAHD